MLMKTHDLMRLGHDVYDVEGLSVKSSNVTECSVEELRDAISRRPQGKGLKAPGALTHRLAVPPLPVGEGSGVRVTPGRSPALSRPTNEIANFCN